MDDGDSDESSGEEFRRKRTAVKQMTFTALPSPSGFRQWMTDVVAICCASSNRDRRRTIRFLKTTEGESEHGMDVVPRKWEQFDTELSQAILRIATGSLRRELVRRQQDALQKGETLAGRLALWLLRHRYMLESGDTAQVEMTRLMNLRFNGDLELYLDSLDTVLGTMANQPDEKFLMALVVPELRKAKAMTHDFVFYDHATGGAKERTFSFLYDAGRRAIQRRREELTKEGMTTFPKVAPLQQKGKGKEKGKEKKGKGKGKGKEGAGQKTKAPCWTFQRTGSCENGADCRFAHVPKDAENKSAETKGKGKEKSKTPCRFFARNGECKNGDSCSWPHVQATEVKVMIVSKRSYHEDCDDEFVMDTGASIDVVGQSM